MPINKSMISLQMVKYLNSEIMDEPLEFDPATPFSEIGVESYDIIQLVLFIERKFGIEIPESELIPENLESIDTLAACAEKQQ